LTENKTVVSTVKDIFRYSNKKSTSYFNDIALLELQESIKIDEFIFPICLPTKPLHNAEAVVTGFGETGTGILSQKLIKVEIQKFDHQTCKDAYEEKYNDTTMLCYGHRTERKDSCGVSLYQERSQGSALGV